MNPVIDILGRKLRLAVIGGAPGSFIGGVHRMAARIDDCYELVCGVMSSTPEKALDAGKGLGFAKDRLYSTVDQMLSAEQQRPDGVDVVAIMTPNDSHYPYSIAALEKGFDVICDKPMTNTLEEARNLVKKVQQTGLIFCLTHNYSGYPLVRQAKAMIQQGVLGDLRLVQVEYVQGGRAKQAVVTPDMPRAWKYDPKVSGPSLVMGDIGTHAHQLLRFITGLEVAEIQADLGHIVPDRNVDDFAGMLLRMSNGARGVMWITQAAAGIENSLKIRLSGSLGSLEWWQEIPQRLRYYPLDGPMQEFTPNGPGILPLAARASRIVKGHPEGFPEAFANLYTDVAQAIGSRRSGKPWDPNILVFPTEKDGYRGVEFVHKVIESSRQRGWVTIDQEEIGSQSLL